MARRKADRNRRPFAEASNIVQRDEGNGTGRERARLFHHSRKRADEPKPAGAQGQRRQSLDSLLLSGHLEALRPGCTVHWATAEGWWTSSTTRRCSY